MTTKRKSDEVMRRLPEYEAAMTAGRQVGFGALMRAAEVAWGDVLEADGMSRGGAHSSGPCVGLLVPCLCSGPGNCNWCCGSGRVTKRVREAMRGAKP